jgi:hypothetical protein
VRPERFELPTFWFVARRSIQLSYGRGCVDLMSSMYLTAWRLRNRPYCFFSDFLASSTERTFWTRAGGVKGFWSRAMPGSRTP